MPAYDYKCPKCGVFLAHTSYETRDDVKCECGETAERLPHYRSLIIDVPEAFKESNRNGYTQMDLERRMDMENSAPKNVGRWV